MIKAVFLDIDNTLLEFPPAAEQAMREGFALFGLPPYEPGMYATFNRANNAVWQRIERGEISRAELPRLRWPSIFRALGFPDTVDGAAFEAFFQQTLGNSAVPTPGAAELLPWLHERYIVCTASNGFGVLQRKRLQKAGFLQYFDAQFISEELGAEKPRARFFEAAMDGLNAGRAQPIQPCEVLMVGDSLTSDMPGGADCGMATCFFDRAGATPLPQGLRVDHVITALPQLRQVLERA